MTAAMTMIAVGRVVTVIMGTAIIIGGGRWHDNGDGGSHHPYPCSPVVERRLPSW
jgi:hypothetical protein